MSCLKSCNSSKGRAFTACRSVCFACGVTAPPNLWVCSSTEMSFGMMAANSGAGMGSSALATSMAAPTLRANIGGNFERDRLGPDLVTIRSSNSLRSSRVADQHSQRQPVEATTQSRSSFISLHLLPLCLASQDVGSIEFGRELIILPLITQLTDPSESYRNRPARNRRRRQAELCGILQAIHELAGLLHACPEMYADTPIPCHSPP
jgi:hypothetical protein